MKTSNNNGTQQTKPLSKNNNNNRPEVRDNLDSRANEEQDNKGENTTHNTKEKQSERSKVKN